MAPWFAGDQEAVYKRMSIMTPLMDGDGYTRDTGSHGQRGYTGSEYRFNFIGATTPLPPRAWRAMGTVGNRLVFHEKQGITNTASVVEDVISGSNYGEQMNQCREVIGEFLRQLWDETEGVGTVAFTDQPDANVETVLRDLTQLIQSARVEQAIPEIDDSELAAVAPTPEPEQTGEQELSGRVYGALRKAWGGYRASLADARDGRDQARHYAEVINGIRVVHGQEPIDFDGMDGFSGPVVSDDPDETYPAGESGSRRLGDFLRSTVSSFATGDIDVYDPVEERSG